MKIMWVEKVRLLAGSFLIVVGGFLCWMALEHLLISPPPNLNTNISLYISHRPIPKVMSDYRGVVPVNISIQAINLNLPVNPVGLSSGKSMGLPVSPMSLAWYKYGYEPGQAGNAVITGHLDTASWQDPYAAFWRLGDLKLGDTIIITGSSGVRQKYIVTTLQTYNSNALPMGQLFGPSPIPQLVLVTCHGVWRGFALGYSQRLIVIAQEVLRAYSPGAGIRNI